MPATDLLRAGHAKEALAQLEAEVRKEPSNVNHRVFLFQLLAILGAWERAAAQLDVVGQIDAKALPMVQTYQTALSCELLRNRVFEGEKSPLIFGDPEDWIAHLLEALRLTASGNHAEAERMRMSALDRAPATPGQIDGKDFEWIADADSRMGPVCEAILNGKYYWIPFHRLQSVEVEPPADLRDFVWIPAKLTFANGGESVALLPTRYPGSETHADDMIRTARRTDWRQVSEGTFLGVGQRMYATDAGEYALMDIRSIQLRRGDVSAAA